MSRDLDEDRSETASGEATEGGCRSFFPLDTQVPICELKYILRHVFTSIFIIPCVLAFLASQDACADHNPVI